MSSKVKLVLTIGILLAALGTTIFFIFKSDIDDSQLTAEQLSRYELGTFYRTTVTSTVQGEIEDKDWGLEKKVTLVHQGEVDFIREVKSVAEDHSKVIVGLEIFKARDLEVHLDLADAKLELPPAVGVLVDTGLKTLDYSGAIDPATTFVAKRASEWLKSDENRGMVLSRLNFAVKATTGKSIGDHLLKAHLQPFEAYEGLSADYTYEAGEGMTGFESHSTLTKEQETRVRDFSVYSEAYLLPDPSEDGPKQWEVDVKNIAHLLAPSQTLDVIGTLTLERGPRNGDSIRLHIVKGKVVFTGENDASQVLGTWMARGSFDYDITTHNVLAGELSGTVALERTSTDHVLFEKSFKSQPSYQILISGFATRDRTEALRPVEDVIISK